MANLASVVFDSHAEADRAVSDLRDAGVPDSSLSIVGRQGEEGSSATGTDEEHGSVTRGILGGGALGAGLGVAALAIPGVGPLAAAGAIAAAAVPGALGIGVAAGAVAGGLNEALHKHGVSDEDVGYYNDRISSGGVFVSVDSDTAGVDAQTVRDILYRNGGHNSSQARMTTV